MSDDLEDKITSAILQLLLEANRQGKSMLSYEEIVTALGMDDASLLTEFEKNASVTLNTGLLDQISEDPDLAQSIIESMGATKH
jgi:hypothetical protein